MNQINYRRCISCRQLAPKKSLWRVIRLAHTHKIQLDRGMGRSAYLCPNIDCLNQVRFNNRLSRSLKARVPEDIYQNLQARLKNV
ncbi:YlxR family protein [Pleurocapsa sp. PCC 7319]|uniref:YlxR family protein n=1 Tax=Pleurocapsa sp. PCC 7319 TaxID=118161 RepID=UPI00034DB963|nr:YlxR family protein [Pleurocapsa sp. PCC 7319]